MSRGSTLRKSSALAVCGSLQERSCFLFKKFVLTVVVLLALSGAALAQTLKTLTHQPPDGIVISFQLTDGTVMVQGNNYSDWWKLTPSTARAATRPPHAKAPSSGIPGMCR